MDAKEQAARAALEYVKDGMVVGLGSGSTAAIFIRLLGEKVKAKKWCVSCIPTSEDSRALAFEAGLHVVGLEEVSKIDVAVDGADAVDEKHRLVKGGGGCQAREKVVAYAAKEFVCIVDESKLKKNFEGVKIPIEVIPFSLPFVKKGIEGNWKAVASVRKGSGKLGPVLTDNGNYILDVVFMELSKPEQVEAKLQQIPGVVATGLFTACKPKIIVGGKEKAYTLK